MICTIYTFLLFYFFIIYFIMILLRQYHFFVLIQCIIINCKLMYVCEKSLCAVDSGQLRER